MRLSKSQFIRGLQCPKSLWLYKYKPELRQEPDESLQAIFESGKEVGELAQKLFPNGVTISYDPTKLYENAKKTTALIKSGIETIYEATFLYDDVLVMVDILHKGVNGWELYEVKSSTKENEVYLNDIAIQYFVVNGSGLQLANAFLIYINNQYVRHGDLDIQSLFTISPQTPIAIQKQESIVIELQRLKEVVKNDSSEPGRDIGLYCYNPYECDFKTYCWKDIPSESVFSLYFMGKQKMFDFYKRGIISFKQIKSEVELTAIQEMQVESALSGKVFINKEGISEFLSSITEPIGYLDFETFYSPIPHFNNQKPYQQIPFQYSLHVQKEDDLHHYEFLAQHGKDPRKEFIENLINNANDAKTVLVYNISFERRILNELIQSHPEYEQEINLIIGKLVDLLVVFKRGYYYSRKMNGSFSIKKVLPALVHGFAYDDLEISDGGMAMNAYKGLENISNISDIVKVGNNLLEYCKLDTLAMVKIHETLKQSTT
ncbi:MAG: DUF2779 domain-containing protein [Desulforudis sp.]|jgi:hypothetical protein|nr:MAG: DUF2779 domain-containing protein [Desulforudis sp.]